MNTPFRRCSLCDQVRPLSAFRPRTSDGRLRHRWCNECHTRSERERRRLKREGRLDKRLFLFAQTVNRAGKAAIPRIVSQMVSEFGGIDGFVRAWVAHYRRLDATRPCSPRLMQFFRAGLRLQELAAESQREELDRFGRQSLDEMKREYRQRQDEYCEQYITEHFDDVLDAARQLGYTVIPPAEPVSAGAG
jgi:hypothetical protein